MAFIKRLLLFSWVFLMPAKEFCIAQKISYYDDLYILFLVDGSTSMVRTDPEEYRKLASQALLSLLSPGDKVAIVQYADRAELFLNWTDASNQKAVFEGVDKISSVGTTDFLLGFRKALELFEEVPESARKIVFLFSDGELSPYPFSNEYAPLHLEYRRLIAGKSRPEIHRIYDKFRHRLAPIARATIDREILPAFREQEIEIFSVAFSDEADQEFMQYLSRQTSLSEIEQRYYYVEDPTDLVKAFMALIPFWQNKTLLHYEEGDVKDDIERSFFIDEYLKDVFVILFSDEPVNFSVNAQGEPNEKPIQGTHPNIHIVPLIETSFPSTWEYRIDGTSGNYKLLIVGESTIRIEVQNLHHRYMFGENLEADVLIKIGDMDAREVLSSYPPQVKAEFFHEGEMLSILDLPETDIGFALDHSFQHTGDYSLKLTLSALDARGRAMLPRPSREYQVTVTPRFYVYPEHLSFGTIKRGGNGLSEITIQNGHEEGRFIEWTSQITGLSRELKSNSVPFAKGRLSLGPEEISVVPIELIVPEGRNWGNFKGEILLKTDHGETIIITFTVHVPSWVEKIAWIIIPMLLLLLAFIIVVLIMWSNLKSPVGVLRPIKFPLGTMINDIKLGRLKRGFWGKYLNWKKNEITIGGPRSAIFLPAADSQLISKFLFYRFGNDYIKNESKEGDDNVIRVMDPSVGLDIELKPGRSYSLSNGLKIKVGEYSFKYEIF